MSVASAAAAATAAPVRTTTPRSRPASTTATTASDSEGRPSATSRRSNRIIASDPLSDRATSALIRRTLCSRQLGEKGRDAQTPIEELLPPLTSLNDVDLQLYALIAIILREFVQSWYSKITTDEDFVAEIIRIIAHCTRGLEQRFRKVYLECLILDEIPDLLDKHVTAYRTSHRPAPRPPTETNPREIYHALCPLPHLAPVPRANDALSVSDQLENEATYRQLLVQAVLAVLLPTEDLENPCLTALVGQLFSELIIGNVTAGKASQPWLLYQGICIMSRVLKERNTKPVELVDSQVLGSSASIKRRQSWSIRGIFVALIQLVIVFTSSIRFIATTLVMASSLPSRSTRTSTKNQETMTTGHVKDDKLAPTPTPRHQAAIDAKTPIVSFSIWSCVGNLIEMRSRMPWLEGFLSLLQLGATCGPGKFAGLDGPVDRLLSHHIRSLFSPSHLPPLLRTLRGVLYPNNAPGKSTLAPPSSDAELQLLRRRAAKSLWDLLPKRVGRLYLGGRFWQPQSTTLDDEEEEEEEEGRMVDEVEGLLMVLNDEYCNKHLMYSILELVLVRLVPELTEKGVVELLDDRLGWKEDDL